MLSLEHNLFISLSHYQYDLYFVIYFAHTGGYLHKIRTSLRYLCPTEHIPPKIEVDLTNLDIGDRVLMHDIEVHPSLKLLSKNDTMPICKILATKPAEPEPRPISEVTETQEALENS